MKKYIFMAYAFSVCFLSVFGAEKEKSQVENAKVQKQEQESVQKETKIVEETHVVTATRQSESVFDVSVAIEKTDAKEIEQIRPAHPSEVLNRMSGVQVNNLGGESHFTAIRNNLSTGANYLFLENGVPTRSTGFFNHNALYEINVPQASGIEVIKGPGSALYGSDAMHGVINVLSGEIPEEELFKVGLEYGDQNWYRHLISYGDRIDEKNAFRLDLNQTFNDGWRDNSEYTRHSFTGQWKWDPFKDLSLTTVFSYNYVDQSLQSGLSKDDWKNNPEENYYHLPGRDVESYRLSTKITKTLDSRSELNFTPYYRNSSTEGLIPSWKLNPNPSTPFNNTDLSEIWDQEHSSYGFLSSYIQRFKKYDSRLILGLDFDYSPGSYKVSETTLTRDFRANGTYFLDYQKTGNRIYDFDPTYTSISPYVHYDFRPVDSLKIDLGLRYDYSEFEIDQYSSDADAIPNQTVYFDQLSPKIGFNWDYLRDHQLYGSYRRGFRAPSAGTLFANPDSFNSTDLEPTTVDSFELGLRGYLTDTLFYDLTAYVMYKKDDIITYRDPNNPNQSVASQNGETEHKGIELSLRWEAQDDWTFGFGGSYSKHTYEEWDIGAAPPWNPSGPSGSELEGNELERAPRYLYNVRANYHPDWMRGGHFELEAVFLGSYYVDQENSDRYKGHEIYNFRAEYPVNDKLRVYTRVMNLLDEETASYVSGSSSTPYRPGEPRCFFFGLEYTF